MFQSIDNRKGLAIFVQTAHEDIDRINRSLFPKHTLAVCSAKSLNDTRRQADDLLHLAGYRLRFDGRPNEFSCDLCIY